MAELTKELQVALEAARAAGRYLRDSIDDVRIETFKEGVHNYATVQDVEAERIIVDTIRRHFSDDAILAEESFPNAASAERLWIVDPLDGTRNYANHLPHFSVSIAFWAHPDFAYFSCGFILRVRSGFRAERRS